MGRPAKFKVYDLVEVVPSVWQRGWPHVGLRGYIQRVTPNGRDKATKYEVNFGAFSHSFRAYMLRKVS